MIHVDNQFIRSDDLVGRVYDTSVEKAELKMPLDVNGRADMILVDGDTVGPVGDLIRLLNETPLAETTGSAAELWQGSGEIFSKIVDKL